MSEAASSTATSTGGGQPHLPLYDQAETDAVHEALLTCFYLASDEERTLRDKLSLGGQDEVARRVTEWGMTEAARRRMRYSLLYDRVLALRN